MNSNFDFEFGFKIKFRVDFYLTNYNGFVRYWNKIWIYPYTIGTKSGRKFCVGGFRKFFHHWNSEVSLCVSFENQIKSSLNESSTFACLKISFYLKKFRIETCEECIISKNSLKKKSTLTYLGISTKFYSKPLPLKWWPKFVGTTLVYHKIIARAARHS